MKHLFYFILITSIVLSNFLRQPVSQKYWIFFSDKADTHFDPYVYFDQKAIDRRLLEEIPLNDPSDWPVNSDYLKQVKILNCEILGKSRWLNAAAVLASPKTIEKVAQLSFVQSIEAVNYEPQIAQVYPYGKELFGEDVKLAHYQIARFQDSLFKKNKLRGKGVRVAIFDSGFKGIIDKKRYSIPASLDSLIKPTEVSHPDNNIIATLGFKNPDSPIDKGRGFHGTAVHSCIAGNYHGLPLGLASGAEFLLAHTEKVSPFQPFGHEEKWIEAAEWADKNGADIISSSIGYTVQRYFKSDFNGQTCVVSRGANIAAQKGILVINAAGNDGSNAWRRIAAPAEAELVLAVGATDPYSDVAADYSSVGPIGGKLKPNVCAPGTVLAATPKSVRVLQGTSFAAPLVAGFAACVKQAYPEMKRAELFEHLQQSGHLNPYYDYAHGYGIPQASYFTNGLKKTPVDTTFKISSPSNKSPIVEINDAFFDEDKFMSSKKNLYFHTRENNSDDLNYYSVIVPNYKESYSLLRYLKYIEPDKAQTIMVHFEGHTQTFQNN